MPKGNNAEFFSKVTNNKDGKVYVISTAKNPYGVWETVIAKMPKSLSLEDSIATFEKPILVLNNSTRNKAKLVHSEIEKIVTDLPSSEWEKSYSKLGSLFGSQQILEEKEL